MILEYIVDQNCDGQMLHSDCILQHIVLVQRNSFENTSGKMVSIASSSITCQRKTISTLHYHHYPYDWLLYHFSLLAVSACSCHCICHENHLHAHGTGQIDKETKVKVTFIVCTLG